MLRILVFGCILLLSFCKAAAQPGTVIVADSTSRKPLANASVFDRKGVFIGFSRKDGRLPNVGESEFPVIIRYMGFVEKTVPGFGSDTIFLRESVTDLPEVVVESKQHKVLHLLAYMREYSTLTTYTDTVFLFREKMVDFMQPTHEKVRFKGWKNPRILKSKSYYRFSNVQGLDSVADRCSHHFSWTDWVGILPPVEMPRSLRHSETAVDTVFGKYSPTEMWARNGDRVTVDVNVLADTLSRKWVPNLSLFFRGDVDFEQFRVRFNYGNIVDETLAPVDMSGYSYNIESNGRGHGMFMFNRRDEPFFVSTYAEIYIVDKEYITVSEARKWERRKVETDDMAILEPSDAPELQPYLRELVDRVNSMNHDQTRLAFTPDERLAGRKVVKLNFGQAALQRLKGMLGIDYEVAKRKWSKNWHEFRKGRDRRNSRRDED